MSFPTVGSERRLLQSAFLFIYPLPQLSNGFPDLLRWQSSDEKELYYWSTDALGRTEMTEEESLALGLPSYHPKVLGTMYYWHVETYEFVREIIEAQGFDPTTKDSYVDKPLFYHKRSKKKVAPVSIININKNRNSLHVTKLL